jgi:2-(1,2-epoxy-1,2-dihydrophenyl)acetyl-CoA isomerase
MERLSFDFEGGVARITLAAPERGNAIDPEWARQFRELAAGLRDRADLRVVVLASQGSAFCVGGDVRYFASSEEPYAALHKLAEDLHDGLVSLAELDAPVLASVQGVAAGAGMSLVLAADLAIAAHTASFTMAYTAVGLTPDGGSSYWLPRLVGHRRAMELMLTNRRVEAAEAAQLGLVTEVVDPALLVSRTEELVAQLAGGPTSSYGAVKRLLAATEQRPYREQLAAEAETIARAAASPNGREGIAAFVQKRRPRFATG